jgi:dynamin 1-like protein
LHNSVILAISAANVELANSDSLKLARSINPQGRQTIGILTKVDLMDAGTHAHDVLTGRVYPLKLSVIGVRSGTSTPSKACQTPSKARRSSLEVIRSI